MAKMKIEEIKKQILENQEKHTRLVQEAYDLIDGEPLAKWSIKKRLLVANALLRENKELEKRLEILEYEETEIRDINEIFGGKMPKTLRDKELVIREIIREIQPCTIEDIIKTVGEKISEEDVRKIFDQLRNYGFILELEKGKFWLTSGYD